MAIKPWFVKQPVGWSVTPGGWLALAVFLLLFGAALVLPRGVSRFFIAPVVLGMFVAISVGRTDLRRLE